MSGRAHEGQSVSCTVKPAVYLHIGQNGGAKTEAAHSGVCVVDVSLPFGKTANVGARKVCVGVSVCARTSTSHESYDTM